MQQFHFQQQKALLLDKNYMAISVITWKRAIALMIKGKAEAVSESHTAIINTTNKTSIKVPSILRLITTIPWKAYSGRLRFSRKHVLIRDNNICQYCGISLGKNGGSIDHIIPTSRGGKSDYLNCVASCKKCNGQKGSKTPMEAGMILISKPKRPTFVSLYRHYMVNTPQEWGDYIIGINVNDD